VLKELWAKVSPSEKFVAYGAVAVVVGWILGQVLGSSTIGGGSVGGYNIPGYTINYFGWGNAGFLELVALVAAIVVGVVLYLKNAPNMNITWPLPSCRSSSAPRSCRWPAASSRLSFRSPTAAIRPSSCMLPMSSSSSAALPWRGFSYQSSWPPRPRNLSLTERRSPKATAALFLAKAAQAPCAWTTRKQSEQ